MFSFLNIPNDDMPALVIGGIIYILDFLVRVWLLFYIPKKRKPTAAMAWLLLIFILPVFGTIIFFILGTTKLSRRRRRAQRHMTKVFREQTTRLQEAHLTAHVPEEHIMAAKLAESLTGLAPTTHNTVEIIYGYDEIITDIVKEIDSAKHHVLIEFYILALDTTTEPFFRALERAIKRGVAVYVLYDMWGSRKFPRRKEMKRRLTKIGAQWRQILPVSFNPTKYNRPDLRNHRKIVVIDSRYAYTGSFNMIDKRYHRRDSISYLELVAKLTGPAVLQLAAVFTSDWYAETGNQTTYPLYDIPSNGRGESSVQVIPSGSEYLYQNNLKTFISLIHSARETVIITNPYLVPDEPLLDALVSAAKRGVYVSILNSEAMDQWMVGHAQRSYYRELLEAGVHISLYKKPQLVHEKFMAIDNEVAVIGSSNLDIRSFELNLECVVVIYDAKVARKLQKHHEKYLEHSRAISLGAWKRRPFWPSLIDSITRLSSALQ